MSLTSNVHIVCNYNAINNQCTYVIIEFKVKYHKQNWSTLVLNIHGCKCKLTIHLCCLNIKLH